LGAIRSAAQMVSYEVSIGLIIMNILITVGSLNVRSIVEFQEYVWFIIPFSPLFILFFVSALAETNRAPFDLPEAEGELVAGFNVEYSSASFALFFIGEYVNIFFMATLSVLLFFGGWLTPQLGIFVPFFVAFSDYFMFSYVTSAYWIGVHWDVLGLNDFIKELPLDGDPIWAFPYNLIAPFFVIPWKSYYLVLFPALPDIFFLFAPLIFALKLNIIVFMFLWVRASVPRYRYDVLMRITWKVFLPLSFGFLIFTSGLLFVCEALPRV